MTDDAYPRCTLKLRARGLVYPRTCAECGLGPCKTLASAPHPAPDATDWKAKDPSDLVRRLREDGSSWAQGMFNEAADALTAAQAENEKLRAALERIMVGGNHVALLIGADHPPAGTDHDKALHHYGAGDQYEAWCCWNTIMLARAALSPPPLSPEKP